MVPSDQALTARPGMGGRSGKLREHKRPALPTAVQFCTQGACEVGATGADVELPSRPVFRNRSLIPHPCSSDIRPAEGQVEREVISIIEACELVGVSRRTIYNWLSSGKIEYVRTAGGSVRIFLDTLWRDPHSRTRPAV